MGIRRGKLYKYIGKGNGPNFFKGGAYFSHSDETLLNAKGIHQPISETIFTSQFQEVQDVSTFICETCDLACIVVLNGGDPAIPQNCLYHTVSCISEWRKV